MIIAIDFDGTVVTHEYPRIGEDVGAVPVLRAMASKGHQLILFTMRSGDELQQAVDWFTANGIPLWGINTNPDQKAWTNSPKAYAQLYIDDAALGCPLIVPGSGRPYVDWSEVKKRLTEGGAL